MEACWKSDLLEALSAAERPERLEIAQQKLKTTREQVDQLRKQGNQEAAEKLMREAEAMTHNLKERIDATRAESAEDLRATLRQVQRDLKELREQLRQLQEQRSGDRK